jgi:rare lipoprotein A
MKRYTFLLLILTSVVAFSTAQTTETQTFRQEGVASWYGYDFAGLPTASGEIFNPRLFTAAHPNLPFGTILTVTNTQNMRQVTVRINDRGPFAASRIIDLSMAAAEALDMVRGGTAPVILEQVFHNELGPVEAPPPAVTTAPATVAPPPTVTAAPIFPSAPVIQATPSFAEAPTAIQTLPPPIVPNPQVLFPVPPAEIRGGIPPAGSDKLYRLQVGAFLVPRNALDAFDRLRAAGLNPRYEQSGEFYRVVLAGLRARDIPAIAQTLGNAGFREAIIREEN